MQLLLLELACDQLSNTTRVDGHSTAAERIVHRSRLTRADSSTVVNCRSSSRQLIMQRIASALIARTTVAAPAAGVVAQRSMHVAVPAQNAAAAVSSSSSSSAKPFRILGLQQIALGALDKNALSHLWVDTFGLTKTSSFQSVKENVDEDICTLGSGPLAIEVDLMQPLDANKSPKVHIPALNHIGLWVDDLKSCVKYLEGKGMRFTPGGIRKGAAGYDVCFLHPKGNEQFPMSGEGVLIELVQAPAEVIAAHKK